MAVAGGEGPGGSGGGEDAVLHVAGYRDLVRVGSGGLGHVYRAVRASTGMPVAIKALRDVSGGSLTWTRARRELEALASLKGHPYVIQVEEILESDGVPVLIMEYAPGGSVASLLDRDGRLTVGETVLVGKQVASALAAAHSLGLVHRDIKPQNILIGSFGQSKVCDFGTSALGWSEEFRAHTNALSYRYASPEELDGDGRVGTPTDVYSLGATLAHCLQGRPPRFSDTGDRRPLVWEAPPLLNPVSAGTLEDLVRSCLAVDPMSRPSSAQVEEQLESLDADLGPLRVRVLTGTGAVPSDPAPRADLDDATVRRLVGSAPPAPARSESVTVVRQRSVGAAAPALRAPLGAPVVPQSSAPFAPMPPPRQAPLPPPVAAPLAPVGSTTASSSASLEPGEQTPIVGVPGGPALPTPSGEMGGATSSLPAPVPADGTAEVPHHESMARAHEPAVAVDKPRVRRRWLGRGLALAGIAVAMVAVGGFALSAGDVEPRTFELDSLAHTVTTTTTTVRPTTTTVAPTTTTVAPTTTAPLSIVIGEPDPLYGNQYDSFSSFYIGDLVAGTCVDWVGSADDPAAADPIVIACDLPHHEEIYFATTVHDQTLDETGLMTMADAACADNFEAYVGRPFLESSFYYVSYYPTVETMASSGQGLVSCSLVLIDWEPWSGTARGSGA